MPRMKRLVTLLLCAVPLAGCRTWDVRAFGVPLSTERRHLMAAGDSQQLPLGTQIAIGAGIALGGYLIWREALD
jgi:hypothetical protein